MPLVKVIRKGVTPHIRKVPTSTAAVMMPVTMERIGAEAGTETEELTKVEDLRDAFTKFQPQFEFRGRGGPEEAEFRADLRFKNIRDFEPENLQKKQEIKKENGETEYLRNDLADLKLNIDLLYRLKDRWRLPAVRRAWNDPTQRKEIIEALGKLRSELQAVAKGGNA